MERVTNKYEALAKVIYSQIAFQGGSDEHFESVRGGMYDDAAQAVVDFMTSDEAVLRAQDAVDDTAIFTVRSEFLGGSTVRNPAEVAHAAILAAVGGSDAD